MGASESLLDDVPEDECDSCFHGSTLHTGQPFDACTVPNCGCAEFIQPENDDE